MSKLYDLSKKLGILCLCCIVCMTCIDSMVYANQLKRIQQWEWINDHEESVKFNETNKRWEIYVDTKDKKQLKEKIIPLLPNQIKAMISTKNQVELIDLTWDESIFEKEFVNQELELMPSFSELYTFENGISSPSIFIIWDENTSEITESTAQTVEKQQENQEETMKQQGDKEEKSKKVEDSSEQQEEKVQSKKETKQTQYATQEQVDKHIVNDAITPFGTIIHVFDYWTNDEDSKRNDPDFNVKDNTLEGGINKGHTLKFSKGSGSSFNKWTNGKNPYTGMVGNTLGSDGYPTLLSIADNTGSAGSLSYVFNPNEAHSGKKSFSNVGGLLQVDEKGYYYYDSTKNYAYFDENTNNFILYDTPGIARNSRAGQFFPFTSATQVFLGESTDGKLENGWTVDQNGKINIDESTKNFITSDRDINHYFGLTMATRFIQQNNGKSYGGSAITYEFSGDDDVWVFIDDVLVADLGGIHDAASLAINFETGDVSINDKITHTLKQAFTNAGKEKSTDWNGNTFANETTHTLRFYYLERGNYESNMSLKFNLVPIQENSVSKVDETGDGVAQANLKLYLADKDYKIQGNAIFEGNTDGNGNVSIVDEEGLPLTFEMLAQENNTNYFVLTEESTPNGYRGQADAHIRYEPETEMIFVEDVWETGNYGNNQITLIAPNEVELQNMFMDEKNPVKLKPYENIDSGKNGKFFAVLQMRKDMDKAYEDETNWAPISGNAQDGWKVSSNNSVSTIVEAAKINPVVLEIDASGALMGTVEHLPGIDFSQYYFAMSKDKQANYQEDLRYVGVLYYTTGITKKSDGTYDFSGVTQQNTQRVTDDSLATFDRKFSTRVSFSNIQNYFVVQKVDDANQPVQGAKFNLYKEEQLENVDGELVVKQGQIPYDSVTTSNVITKGGIEMQGAAIFPSAFMYGSQSQKLLEQGVYYVVEDDQNEQIQGVKYEVNKTPIKVIVDNQNVYANAGVKGDGITTSLSVASVIGSMVQFAVDDKVDTTLRDIKAQMLTSNSSQLSNAVWSTWDKKANLALQDTNNGEMHLSYVGKDPSGYYEAQVIDQKQSTRTLRNEEGWSKLEIHQCLSNGDNDLKTKLVNKNNEEIDISNLFIPTLMITVTNQRKELGSLRIEKIVNGSEEDQQKDFTFDLTFHDEYNQPLNSLIRYQYNDENEMHYLKVTDGKASITLHHDQYLTFYNILKGTTYHIEEQSIDGFQVSSKNEQGTIREHYEAKVQFINTRVIDIQGNKTWKDQDNIYQKRPENITVRLYADGKELDKRIVSEKDNWSWNFKQLPEYKGNKKIQYTLTEDEVAGYEAEVNGFNIINHYNQEKINIPVQKVWDDENDLYKKRPDNIVVELYADGAFTNQKIILSEENQWQAEFKNVDLLADGKEITYEVKEIEVAHYKSNIQGNMKKGFIITNVYTQSSTPIIEQPDENDSQKGSNDEHEEIDQEQVVDEKYPDNTQDDSSESKPNPWIVMTSDTTHKFIWAIVCGVTGIGLFIFSRRKK